MLLSMETLRSSPYSPSEPFGRKQQFFMQNTTARRRNRSSTAILVITMTLPCWPKGRAERRHRGSLHPRRAQRRSKPSIGSEGLFHNCNLPPLSAQVGFATMGRSGGFDDHATRPRELAERAGEEE